MPQLDPKQATATDKAATGWEMDPDIYKVQLTAVEDTNPRTREPYVGKAGPYWRWEVTFPDHANGGKYKRRKLRKSISTGGDNPGDPELDKSAGIRRQAFAAFGADASVNTDTLLGRYCLVQVDNEESYSDPTTMEAVIKKFMPLPADDPDYGKGGGTSPAAKKAAATAAKNESDKF